MGLPLTLRGERGAQAQETELSSGAPRRCGRARGDLRRAVHDGAGRPGGGRSAEDARAAAHLLTSYLARAEARLSAAPRPSPCDRRGAGRARRRGRGRGLLGGRRRPTRRPWCRPAAAPPPKPLHIVFPEGFTRKQMAARITAVDQIARKKRHVNPKLRAEAVPRSRPAERAAGPVRRRRARRQLEGFLFPATYDFIGRRPRRSSSTSSSRRSTRAWTQRRPEVREVEEPDAVRRPDHRVDDREGGGRPGGAEAHRGGDLQPAPRRAAAGIDATVRYGFDVPGRRRCASLSSRATTRTTRASGRACRRRRSRTRGWRRSRRPRIPRR